MSKLTTKNNSLFDFLTLESIAETSIRFAGKQIAVIDLDATLSDSFAPFCIDLCNRLSQRGVNIDFSSLDQVSFDVIYSLQNKYPQTECPQLYEYLVPQFVYEGFNTPQVYEDALLIEDTANLVRHLHKLEYKIIYATSRPNNTQTTTLTWLEKHNLPIDQLFFEKKDSVLGNVEIRKKNLIVSLAQHNARGIFYDDKPETLVETIDALSRLDKEQAKRISIYAPYTTWNTLPGSHDELSKQVQHLLLNPADVLQKLGL